MTVKAAHDRTVSALLRAQKEEQEKGKKVMTSAFASRAGLTPPWYTSAFSMRQCSTDSNLHVSPVLHTRVST